MRRGQVEAGAKIMGEEELHFPSRQLVIGDNRITGMLLLQTVKQMDKNRGSIHNKRQ